jgi:lipoprotein-anchoring transpeptidase ErfK/SrfK
MGTVNPRSRPRLSTLAVVAAMSAAVVLPGAQAATASSAAGVKHVCGKSWVPQPTRSYALFPPEHRTTTIYKAPGVTNLQKVKVLKDPAADGTRGVVLGYDANVTGVVGWMYVHYADRSNRAVGWVRVKDVQGITNQYAIYLNRAARQLAVVKNLTTCWGVFPVAVGAPATPTPRGTFYVNDRIPAPNAAYGHFLLGTNAYSPDFVKFNNLDAAIGLHGTNDPGSIGKAVSHGCIRMNVAQHDRLFRVVNVGTPIFIS